MATYRCTPDQRGTSPPPSGHSGPWSLEYLLTTSDELEPSVLGLPPGSIVILAPGRYRLPMGINVRCGGTADRPIRIVGESDIHNLEGSLPTLDWTRPVERWTPFTSTPAGVSGVWSAALPAEGPGITRPQYGGFFRVDGQLVRLVSYVDREDFFGSVNGTSYVGPGTFVDGEQVFVRLESPNRDIVGPPDHLKEVTGLEVPEWDLSSALEKDVDLVEGDPSPAVDLALIAHADNAAQSALVLTSSPGHIEVENVRLYNGGGNSAIGPIENLRLTGVKFDYPGSALALGSAKNTPSGVRIDAREVSVSNCEFDGHVPAYLPRDATKEKSRVRGATGRAITFTGTGIDVVDSVLRNDFDAIYLNLLGNSSGRRWNGKVSGCEFEGFGDDTILIRSDAVDVDVAHNTIARCSSAFSRQAGGLPPTTESGTVYIHHNCVRLAAHYLKPSRSGINWYRTLTAFSTTHGTVQYPPWKIYHNTVIEPGPVETLDNGDPKGTGGPYRAVGDQPVAETQRAFYTQEVFNNIFIHHAERPALGVGLASISSNVREPYGAGHFILDGNTYSVHQDHDLFKYAERVAKTLGAFRTAPQKPSVNGGFTLLEETSSAVWEAGWESQGRERDPLLDENFHPEPGPDAEAPVALARIRSEWPGTDLESTRFVGAKQPPGDSREGGCLIRLLRLLVEALGRVRREIVVRFRAGPRPSPG